MSRKEYDRVAEAAEHAARLQNAEGLAKDRNGTNSKIMRNFNMLQSPCNSRQLAIVLTEASAVDAALSGY